MPSNLQIIIGSVVLVIAIFSGVVVEWEFDKDYTVLKRDGVILAKEKWVVFAERSYINLNSWYRRNVMCPRIIEDGGHISPSGTRCYYPDDYYKQLSRSLIKTKIEVDNTAVIKSVPHYAYGTSGSYAGYLVETMEFTETDKIEEFPNKYNINWKPKDTRNYKLVWRVEDIKDFEMGKMDLTACLYQFGNLKIDLRNECDKLDKVVLVGKNDLWFYFDAMKGEQNFNLGFVDPPVLTYMGETCSEDPADYETFNDTGFSYSGMISNYINMETTVSSGQYTFLVLNWKHISDSSYPNVYLRDSTTTSFLRMKWNNDDFNAYDDAVLTKVADAPDGAYYNWSVSFDFESDQFNATLDDVIVASNWGIYDHTKNFSRMYLQDTFAGLVEASDFYVFEGSECPTTGAADSCTPPASPANWAIDQNDKCVTNSNVNITGYNISYYCTGACDGSHTINTTIWVDQILNGSDGMMINGTPNGKVYGGEK